MTDPYDGLYRAIGRVVYEWGWLENDVSLLVFDLCSLHSKSFYDDPATAPIATALSLNIDLKTNIAIAKTLAHLVDDREGFYERAEAALNPIANDLRNERNRYVHDTWHMIGTSPVRHKAGTNIRKIPGSGKTEIQYGSRQLYPDLSEVEAFADKIYNARLAVTAVSEEAQGLYRSRNQLGE